MSTTHTPTRRDPYLELVRQFPLKVIRTATEHEDALAAARPLMLRDDLSVGERQYLDVLATLIEDYESKAYPRPAGKPHQRLRHLAQESGTSQAELARIMGIKQPMVSLLLTGKRGMTMDAVKRLSAHFRLSADYFI